MAKEKKAQTDLSTEQKIKDAASMLFTKNGFAATKTRDIAEAAGINLALLNYYFRSKQKLYDIIMEENMSAFKQGISDLFGDATLDVPTKIEKLANFYIDEFLKHRDLPAFIISAIQAKSMNLMENDNSTVASSRKVFVKQLQEWYAKRGRTPLHPAHIISNLIGLILFPFLISPMLKQRAQINDKEFVVLMEQRKKLIPIWIKSMLEN